MSESSWPRRGDRPFPAVSLTDRPLTARTLAAAEPWLAVAGIGAWHYHPDGDLWWSHETRRIHGVDDAYRPDLATAIDFYLPEHRDIVRDAVARAVASGERWDLELGIIRADGQRRQVRARGRPARPGTARAGAIIGTFEDITARHDAAQRAAQELELRTRTETLLRDVITGIPAALSVYDSEERLILVNESYRNILPGNRQFMVPGERLADIITRKVMANHYVPEISADDPPEARAAWVADYLRQHRKPGYNRVFHLRHGGAVGKRQHRFDPLGCQPPEARRTRIAPARRTRLADRAGQPPPAAAAAGAAVRRRCCGRGRRAGAAGCRFLQGSERQPGPCGRRSAAAADRAAAATRNQPGRYRGAAGG
jgi:PAS domain-containing protein